MKGKEKEIIGERKIREIKRGENNRDIINRLGKRNQGYMCGG